MILKLQLKHYHGNMVIPIFRNNLTAHCGNLEERNREVLVRAELLEEESDI